MFALVPFYLLRIRPVFLSWFPAAATLCPLYTISTISTSLSIYELLFGFRLANVYLYFRLDSTASFRLVWICLFSLALHNTRPTTL